MNLKQSIMSRREFLILTCVLLVWLGPLPISARAPLICGTIDNNFQTIPSGYHAASSASLPAADTLSEPVVIEVMFLYTSQALNGAGSAAKIRRTLMQSIDLANYCFTNSKVNIRIRPVYIGEIAYNESGDINTDLSRLRNNQGSFAKVSSLRADYKADIVCLLIESDSRGTGGAAAEVAALRGNSAAAFAVVLRSQLGQYNTTLTHELAHLMGCAHDREHVPDLGYYKNFRAYIFGYRFAVQDVTYTDVMAYEPGIGLPLFSNPRMDMDGVSLGIAQGSEASDTSRTINETAPYVASYRKALSRIEFTSPEYHSDKASATARVHLSRTGDLDTSLRVSISISPQSTAKPDFDYTLPAQMNVEFAANQSEATFEIPLLKTALSEATKTILLSLGSPAPSTHGIGWNGTTTVYIADAPPVVHVSGDPIIVQERQGWIEIQLDSIEQLGASAFDPPVSTIWHVEPGTAIAGKDYVPASGKITYAAQPVAGGKKYIPDPIRIELLDDVDPEPDETMSLIFDAATKDFGAYSVQYTPVSKQIRIIDNDRLGSVLRIPGKGLNQDAAMGLAVRYDGKMMVWGWFDKLRGIDRTGIGLLNADGSVDQSFIPPTFLSGHKFIPHLSPSGIWIVKFQPDGKLLVGGSFSRVNGQARGSLVRLNQDGSLDDSFSKAQEFDGSVSTAAILPEGQYMVGGRFEKINGVRRPFLARFGPNGTVDDTFQPQPGPESSWFVDVLSIAADPDGKTLIGGYFEKYNGLPTTNIARLNADGTLDSSFKLNSATGPVSCIRLLSDRRILLAGSFSALGGRSSRAIGRVLSDGSPDPSFVSPQPNADVYDVLPLADGKFFAIGAFTEIAHAKRRFIALLNSDGSLDSEFDPGSGPDEIPDGAAIHADGTLYVSGRFERISDTDAPSLAALKIGLPRSAIAESAIDPRTGALVLRGTLFPGSYFLEATTDLNRWSKQGSFMSEGFGLPTEIRLSPSGTRQFFRLTSGAP